MQLAARRLLLTTLVAAFCGQTALVYLDDTADRGGSLSPAAIEGRRIWHDHNCQVCHQLYGMGGFLGPDLTNAASRLTRVRLDEILTKGAPQMPPFRMQPEQISAIEAFLREIDRTGVGVARRQAPLDPRDAQAAVAAQLEQSAPGEPVARGWRTFQSICSACHVPFRATPLGPHTAPDLTTVCDRLDAGGIQRTIEQGRIDRGMPPWSLGAEATADLVALLQWIGRERPAIAARLGAVDRQQGLPWWEFK